MPGLRLDPIADELGVSRQAILHHFGTRDGLIATVVQRALEDLQTELAEALAGLTDRQADSAKVIERSFEVIVDGGYGRLLGWLALEHGDHTKMLLEVGERPLAILAGLSHAVRERDVGASDPRDTLFTVVLSVYAILGSAVFERGVFRAAGLDEDPKARDDFRAWLTRLLVGHLETPG